MSRGSSACWAWPVRAAPWCGRARGGRGRRARGVRSDDVPRPLHLPGRGTVVTLVVLLALALAAYLVVRQVKPILIGSGCQADARGQEMPLDPEQAGLAATIAAVAQ